MDLSHCLPFLQNLSFLDRSLEKFPAHTRQKQRARILEKLVQSLTYEQVEADEVIFRFGDHGNKFYIVIEGEVAIMVPRSKEEIMKLSQNEEGELQEQNEDPDTLLYFERIEAKGQACFSGPIPIYEIKRKLGNLSSFGEVALTYSGMRTATVCTTMETHLISLDKKSYLEILESSSDDILRFLKFLKKCFDGLNKFSLVNLMCLIEEVSFRLNHRLMQVGTIPDYCYIIKKGSVRVSRQKLSTSKKPEKLDLLHLLDRNNTRTIKRNLDISLLTDGAVIGFREIVERQPFHEDGYISEDQTSLFRIKARVVRV